MIDTKELDNIIIGRVEPRIYAFSTNTIPNYLKVGDTYRPVSERLKEWQEFFPKLKKEYETTAKVDDNVYFRDYSIHQYLEEVKGKLRLTPDQFPNLYYSKEFFKDTRINDLQEAINDIHNDYENGNQNYHFYNTENRLPEIYTYARTETYEPRIGTQDVTIKRFKQAIANGRTNLLMYAVMRFGKSFTAMCCANEMNAKLVVVVSGKADIKEEWKKTVESHIKFKEYKFITSEDLIINENIISETIKSQSKVVVFLTLQDLMGNDIKEKHKDLFSTPIDLLLVDESHFGARAEKFGAVLNNGKYEKDYINKKDTEDIISLEKITDKIKVFNPKVTIHMSGTPYRILMSDEFTKEDIIAFYQFTDIVDKQEQWNKENILKDEVKEWDNPYFGFPQMIRFAFNPNKSTIEKLNQLKKNGYTYAFSELLKPLSIKKDEVNESHTKFKFEKEVLELFETIDGSKTDENLLSFLNYDKIKLGKMCNHIVIVLPYCASCDALEKLIIDNNSKFKNLNNYEILNLAGWNMKKKYSTISQVKNAISNFDKQGKKTICLTVNRMLTGCTIPEWDTMIYLKDTASPQEYDQSIFRLQSQFIKSYVDDDGNKIKINMKPQTLLVDFDPNRMFYMQEQKAQIYNVNIDKSGNSKLQERINKELQISPIITLNKNKIVKVIPNDILEAVSNYKKDKGIKEEALALPVDLNILRFDEIRNVINKENEIDSKLGLITQAHKSEDDFDGDDLDIDDKPNDSLDDTEQSTQEVNISEKKEEQSLSKKIQNYYTRILLFAFLTEDKVISLEDIISIIDKSPNDRIANNLGLNKKILKLFNDNSNQWVLRKLDYSIQDLNSLSSSADINTAFKKFGKLGEAIVITPNKTCDDMINLLPGNLFDRSQNNSSKFLDIAGTAGEFALSIYNRMKENKNEDDYIKNAIYTITKSSICYELTRKVYEMLDLNVNNISRFYAQDLLEIKNDNKVDYDKICDILTQDKDFCEIDLTEEPVKGGKKVKFEAVVGNPPYQDQGGSGGNNDAPIYQHFSILADKLSSNSSTLIIKAGWFSAGRENLLGDFRVFMLNNKHLKKLTTFIDSNLVFGDNVEIKGGICYYCIDKNYVGDCEYSLIDQYGNIDSKYRKLNDFDILIREPVLSNIVKKVKNINTNGYVDEIVSSDTPFGIPSNPKTSKKNPFNVYSNINQKHNTLLYHIENNKRKIEYVSLCDIKKNKEFVNKVKVFITGAGGSGNDQYIIGKPEFAPMNSVCSQSYLFISFNNDKEAKYFIKYMYTKFFRVLVKALKITQSAPKRVYRFVPLQDFTDKSDIDWSKSIPEIDQQLYKKYNLTEEEVNFIESKIKPME